ncbi:LPS export ABC transporter permease LptF [Mangrovimicrobium sediminis]|uniref:Lipopolysaccharide export system permease protein LptF n=1 Tax=Mangrovimicrobium sediminis TaxID=2562682 RepID=A0A4Z0LXH6_9GAMM|nr:LPS export ABC transporter permease LptF [Haliea sp. SAOS-164]TGD71934.1 LPS export ABC transporter permease LptF [Haliea sp. SAOS-164]
MKILRYLARDVLTHMVAVSFVLLVIIFSGRFVKYLAEAASGDLAADILLPVMFYRMPGFLELILPLGLFIGILMAYGRLYVESEMVVLTACGLSPGRLALYTLLPAGVVMAVVALLSLWVTPLGASHSEALLHAPESSAGPNAVAAGRFQVQRGSETVTYAQTLSPEGVMHDVFLSDGGADERGRPRLQVTVAEEGEVRFDPDSGVRYLELRNGYRYSGYPGELDYRVVQFRRYGEMLPEPEGGIRTADPVDGRATRVLLHSSEPENVAALHWRLSLPVMVPIVAIIALCMSRTDHRRGRYIKMAPAFILYLVYLVLLARIRGSIADGDGGPLRLWSVHLLFAMLALGMLYSSQLLGWLRARRHAQA